LLGGKASTLRLGRRSRAAGGVGFLALLATLSSLAAPALARDRGGPSRAGTAVGYHGLRIAVPAGWPVVRLSSHPSACVRFDRHAVYLGVPGTRQRCPAHALGRTGAILVQPLAAGAAGAAGARGAGGPAITGGSPSAGQLALPRRGLLVTATWGHDRRVVERALGERPLHAVPSRPRAGGVRATAAARHTKASTSGVFTGLGFDACSAPSTSAMSAWGSSPYRAIGVYIGGANSACSQPNLTAAWVSAETAAGWHLIPTYVGLQAPGACGCARISLNAGQAAAQGSAAASDAVTRAQAVGIGPGNPIYDDMEGYPRSSSNTAAVLAFVSGWTHQLHALGYVSGVYSSGDSGIADLAAAYGSNSPDDIWIARWNNQQSTSDPVVPSTEWASHQRLHQYAGAHNATYGGVTLNIDSNYLDGATAGATATVAACTADLPDGTFVQVTGSYAVYRIAGGAPMFISQWSNVGGEQPVDMITTDAFATLCPVPRDGTFLGTNTGAYYRVAGGAPLLIGDWNTFGGVQPFVGIDQWDIVNAGNPVTHLNARPASGTVVHALPSDTYWQFTNTYRTPAARSSRAIAVDDAGLAPFPIVQCTVPRLRHFTFPHAKKAIRRAHCSLGKVHRPHHWSPRHRLRVYRQIPHPGAAHGVGWRVGIKMR
jgi:hypothetical protein